MDLEKIDPVFLLVFFDKVTGSLDSGADVDFIFSDFAKAFDKLPHHRL